MKEKIMAYVKNKNNWMRLAGGGGVSVGAFMVVGLGGLIFMLGLMAFLSTDD